MTGCPSIGEFELAHSLGDKDFALDERDRHLIKSQP